MTEQKKTSRPRHGTRRGLPWRKALLPLLIAAVVLVGAVLVTALRGGPGGGEMQTLPQRVQAQMPEWVDQRLLTPNEYSRPGIPVTEVNAVVIHYVGNPDTSAEANRNYFEGLGITGETYASSNFVVGLAGEVIQCVPVDEVAYCSAQRNSDTVSIEVCHPDETGEFNSDTRASVVQLTAWLCLRFGLTSEDVIRHYDVTGKECPIYYVRHEDAWEALKADVDVEILRLRAEKDR